MLHPREGRFSADSVSLHPGAEDRLELVLVLFQLRRREESVPVRAVLRVLLVRGGFSHAERADANHEHLGRSGLFCALPSQRD